MLSCLLQGHRITVYYFLMSFILQRESDSFDITNLYWIYLFLLSIPTQLMMFLGSWKKDFTMTVHYILPVLSDFKYPETTTPVHRDLAVSLLPHVEEAANFQ